MTSQRFIGDVFLFFYLSFFLIVSFFFLVFGYTACGILVSCAGIQPTPLAVEAWSLNHWITREVPLFQLEERLLSHVFCPLEESPFLPLALTPIASTSPVSTFK